MVGSKICPKWHFGQVGQGVKKPYMGSFFWPKFPIKTTIFLVVTLLMQKKILKLMWWAKSMLKLTHLYEADVYNLI
jgi:hypothetical protein